MANHSTALHNHRFLSRLVRPLLASLLLFGSSTSSNATPPETAKQLMMDAVIIMNPHELAVTREMCVRHQIGALRAKSEARNGPGSFPDTDVYCLAALREAADDDQIGGLYLNLAVQQLGVGYEFMLASDEKTIGDTPVRIMRNAMTAAAAGKATYRDATGTKDIALTCPMALDAGFTFAVSNVEARPEGFTPEQVQRMAKACFDPSITEVTIAATGETMPVQRMGWIAGRLLAHKYRDKVSN